MAGRNGARAVARKKRTGGNLLSEFEAKVQKGTARIGIIGLGYVGLPLAVEFAKKGFRVTGFEINKKRVGALNSGRSLRPTAGARCRTAPSGSPRAATSRPRASCRSARDSFELAAGVLTNTNSLHPSPPVFRKSRLKPCFL